MKTQSSPISYSSVDNNNNKMLQHESQTCIYIYQIFELPSTVCIEIKAQIVKTLKSKLLPTNR